MWELTRMEILVLRQAQDEDFLRTEANSRPHPELVEGRGRLLRGDQHPTSKQPKERPETAKAVSGLFQSSTLSDGCAVRNQKISNRPAAPLWIA
ncbi:hypothetical protein [Caulobacter vibrioides]|uniref:Uncharacterized protein n=2 Tax=Caulobacter vibrioides TaxID=155892 RepID=Q9A2U3_CAUVC|nr:hypothetical protein [Caulobacter vibrioides]YP_002518949.1 hypothetical protein CCNA_03576 [Caulobacter vibrioides NA1000]AAK25425.1 hypothetical protein CC_3463 [Caulobacter vibrioides CB15]ACL97041.1 hypothetical protein CCNA_03576 [Caulobacter vibrioides NA1000]ATC30284.1 hypothetical protein CA607_18585 [Caulobacter vibrioides]QXZ51809.1 hypothetical protein KZH45_18325 [Caulobacter vibrioides]